MAPVQEDAGAHRFIAQHHVLCDRQRGDEHKVLVDHADALGDGVTGAVDGGFLPPNDDLPFIRGIQAVEGVHQGGFSRPVLS